MKKLLLLIAPILLLISLFPCQQSAIESTKTELLNAAGGTSGLDFEILENETGLLATLTNPDILNQIELNQKDTTVLLGYTIQKEGQNENAPIYQSSLIQKDGKLYVELSNLSSQAVERFPFPEPTDISDTLPGGPFETLDDCFDYIECAILPDLRELANETCETQFFGYTCCANDSEFCVSIHYIIEPTNIICRFRIRVFETQVLVAQ